MTIALQGAKNDKVLGIITGYVLGDYTYIGGIIAGDTGRKQILVVGRKLKDSKIGADPVLPNDFPEEIVKKAVAAYPNIRWAGKGENRELVTEYFQSSW